ncbi:MAG: GntR family transcriptional regulator, partial [Candidatus Rokuibacteriota bacterium]
PGRREPAPPPPPGPARAASIFPAPLKHETLEELAYQHIRRAIIGGQLAPGQRIVAQAVAREAGISRIPVMQALRRLESEGFVRINPHKDVVVAALSLEEFRERFLLMAALEALCVRESEGKFAPAMLRRLRALAQDIAAARARGDTTRAVAADGEFHRALWEVSGLKQAIQILQNVWDRGEYYRYIMHARRGGFAADSLTEHEEILAALEAGDTARAARAVETHRLHAMERLATTT